MRITPQLRSLDWLVAKPIAHRGLHDEKDGRVENCAASFAAAIAAGYAIECDIQLTADGEAVVFHDDTVERVLDGTGDVKAHSLAALQRMAYRQGKDKIQTLQDLLDQTAGRSTLVIEIKSLWDDDYTLTDRAVACLSTYPGPFALMSFDPHLVARVAATAGQIVRGITADRVIDPYYDGLSMERRIEMQEFSHLPQTRPHFISFDWHQLPYPQVTAFRAAGNPIITWTIESQAEADAARQWSDQITFEHFLPA